MLSVDEWLSSGHDPGECGEVNSWLYGNWCLVKIIYDDTKAEVEAEVVRTYQGQMLLRIQALHRTTWFTAIFQIGPMTTWRDEDTGETCTVRYVRAGPRT